MVSNNQNPAQNGRKSPLFEDGARILDIRYDPVFKAVFIRDTSTSRAALSDFISTLIKRNVAVETIVIKKPSSDFPKHKKFRYDITCRSEDGKLVNVEMAFHAIDEDLSLAEYFVSKLFLGEDAQDIDEFYSNVKDTYQISIMDQKSYYPDRSLTHTFQLCDPKTNVSLNGNIRIITLELEKTEAIIDKPVEEMTNTELWAAYFQYLTDESKREKIKEIISREEGIAMAMKTLCQITADEEEYAILTNLIKGELEK
jgi:hypothetical protein